MADYPFTTLEPVLGTLERDDRQLVLADIPGLIEGASAGAGLGHEFLAHVERCRLLVHVLDLAPLDGSDPVDNHATVEAELREHGHGLAGLPRILCLSKADLVPPEEARGRRARTGASAWARRCCATSAATGAGVAELRDAIFERVPPEARGRARRRAARHAPRLPARERATRSRVERAGPGAFRVEGGRIERLVARHDVDNDDALRYVEERLRALGVIRALEAAGFEPGDDVEIAGIVFELDPGAPSIEVQPMARLACRCRVLVLALGACGGGDDGDEAKQTVRDFVKATNDRDGDSLCDDLVTQEYIGEGDRRDRRQGAATPASSSSSLITGLKLRWSAVGDAQGRRRPAPPCAATIAIGGQRRSRSFQLAKEDGNWKLVGGSGSEWRPWS